MSATTFKPEPLRVRFATEGPSAADLLELCRAASELTVACGTALGARALSQEQLQKGSAEDLAKLEKTTRKLTATAVTLAENAAALSAHLAGFVGAVPTPTR